MEKEAVMSEAIKQTVEPQAVRDARKAAHDAKQATRAAEKAAKRQANPDNKPVTWGDLRALGLVDD
jgi:hypothetical protein